MINLQNIKNIINKTAIIIIMFICFFTKAFAIEHHSFTLRNGLEAHIIKTNNPIITHAIAYNVGSVEENSSQEGIAHLLEHLMFLGTNKYSKEELSDIIKYSSAYYNAFTSFDITLYYMSYPAKYLEKMIEVEADRMKWLKLDKDVIQNEKQVIKEERNMYQNRPYTNFYNLFYQAQFPTTNYGRTIIGFEEVFNDISIQEIKQFYKKWYNPNNAKVFIIGNIDFQKGEQIIRKYFGKLKNTTNSYNRSNYLEQELSGYNRINYSNERIRQEIFLKSYLVPSINSDTSKGKSYAYSLMILQKILSLKSNRLYKELVLDKNLAVEVSSFYNASRKGHTNFSISILPKEGVSHNEIEEALNEVLYSMIDEGFTSYDVKNALRNIRDEVELSKEDEKGYIFNLAIYSNAGLPIEDILDMNSFLREVNSKMLNKVAKELISKKYVIAIAQKQ